MSKVTDYNNLPIGSTVEEIDKECKEGEPVVFYGKVIYTVKNTYTIISSCANNKYYMQDAGGIIKEVTAKELMSEKYLVETLKDNVCIFEIYDTTYEKVCTALKQIEKETKEEFDRIHPKPYPSCIKEETEKYRNEVVYESKIRSIGNKEGFCHFYIMNERPELIHAFLRYLGKNLGKAELTVNDKKKRPNATTDYGVYVLFQLEVDKDGYEKAKAMFIEENYQRKAGE